MGRSAALRLFQLILTCRWSYCVSGFVVPSSSNSFKNGRAASNPALSYPSSSRINVEHSNDRSKRRIISLASGVDPMLEVVGGAIYNSVEAAGAIMGAEEIAVAAVAGTVAASFEGIPIPAPIDAALHEQFVWSNLVMLSIVGLLVTWEELVKTVRKSLPDALLPVIESMLAEISGLGFVGLFLSAVVTGTGGILGHVIEEISEHFLGDGEILLESFEFLHTAFFEVGIAFFVVSGVVVGAVLAEIQELSSISLLCLDTDGDGEVSLDELADALSVQSIVVDADGDGDITDEEMTDALRKAQKTSLWSQISKTNEEIISEALVVREQLLLKFKLPDSFEIERYFEYIFGHNLEEIVEFSPVTWLPLIPLLAFLDAVDLSHDVVSAASANAFSTAGEFISTPLVLYPSIALQVTAIVWGMFNFWKMASIKSMLVPTLVRDGGPQGPAVLLPPRYQDEKLRQSFNSSPDWVKPIEEFFRKEKPTDGKENNGSKAFHTQLFGAAGESGPEMYRNSIKFHTWLCVTMIVFYTSQIVFRDFSALVAAVSDPEIILRLGNAETVLPELLLFGAFVVFSIAQLTLTPRTFLYYSYATSIEEYTQDWAMAKAIDEVETREKKKKRLQNQMEFCEDNTEMCVIDYGKDMIDDMDSISLNMTSTVTQSVK